MSETVKIIGIKKQANKNNPLKIGCTIYFTQPFDAYSVSNAQELSGLMCGSEFTYEDIQCEPGDEVRLIYTKGFQNMAVLSGIEVVTPGNVPSGSKK